MSLLVFIPRWQHLSFPGMGLSIVVSPSSTDLFEASNMLSEDENLTHHVITVEAVLSGTRGPSDLRNSLYKHFFLYCLRISESLSMKEIINFMLNVPKHETSGPSFFYTILSLFGLWISYLCLV